MKTDTAQRKILGSRINETLYNEVLEYCNKENRSFQYVLETSLNELMEQKHSLINQALKPYLKSDRTARQGRQFLSKNGTPINLVFTGRMIPEDLAESTKELARAKGVPHSIIVEIALTNFLKNNK